MVEVNKHLIPLAIVVLLICVGLSGCTEEKSIENLVTAPLNTLMLTIDDLPQGYIKLTEGYNYTDGGINGILPVEYYFNTFAFENPEDTANFPAIALFIMKFNSSDDADNVFYNQSEQISNLYSSLDRITPQDVKQIGDESIFELYEGSMGEHYGYQNTTISFCYFRLKNVAVNVYLQGIPDWEIDYVSLTINYAEVIEERINES